MENPLLFNLAFHAPQLQGKTPSHDLSSASSGNPPRRFAFSVDPDCLIMNIPCYAMRNTDFRLCLMKEFKFDRSSKSLLFSNIFTMVIAVVEGWSISDVMWIYWGQSIVIGYFNWRRILALREFSTDGFTMNGKPIPVTKESQRQTASFFAMHFGFFHAFYLLFLLLHNRDLDLTQVLFILLCVAIFGANHCFSYYSNLEDDLKGKPNLGTIMFFPYVRIVPMHIMIVIGSLLFKKSMLALLFFLSLKAAADLVSHFVEHKVYGERTTPPSSGSPEDAVCKDGDEHAKNTP